MSRRIPLALTALLTALALWWVPATASATVYCVDDTPGNLGDNLAVDASCETGVAEVSAALTAAEVHAGADSVLIGPGDFTLPAGASPSEVEAYYYSGGAAGPIELRGSGTASTHLTMGGTSGFEKGIWINASAGSVVSDFELTIPPGADVPGEVALTLDGTVARDLLIDGPGVTNAVGVALGGGTPALHEVTVDLPVEASPSNSAVRSTTGAASIADSHLRATVGVANSGNPVSVERSVVDARTGSSSDSGSIEWRDSLIELGSRVGAIGVQAANYNNGNAAVNATVDGVTIVGGGSGSIGVRAMADSGTETATVDVSSSVIEGPAKPLAVIADNGRTATLAIAYSNFNQGAVQVIDDLDGTGEAGTATYAASEVTSLPPSFVDAAGGNFHLAPGSALIDRGDPAEPAGERLDLDGGARAASSLCPGGPGRRDIGADEFEPTCVEAPGEPEVAAVPQAPAADEAAPAPTLPQTTIRGRHRVAAAGATALVRLRLGSSEARASFRCRVDGRPWRRCAKALSLKLRRGRHVVRARAIGVAGADPSPARFEVRIVAKAHETAAGVHNR
jgi:hypothetical protein